MNLVMCFPLASRFTFIILHLCDRADRSVCLCWSVGVDCEQLCLMRCVRVGFWANLRGLKPVHVRDRPTEFCIGYRRGPNGCLNRSCIAVEQSIHFVRYVLSEFGPFLRAWDSLCVGNSSVNARSVWPLLIMPPRQHIFCKFQVCCI